MNKFYLIDKPLEITSFDILRNLKKKLNIKKMGHTGTLDPLATGLVLVAV
jgi:tRNA pseudouridine55 synthase